MMQTIVGLLTEQARDNPDRVAYRLLEEGEVEGPVSSWTYGELDRRVRAVAAFLSAQDLAPGDRVVLLYLPSLDFISALLACFEAGVVAVPVWPPDPARLSRGLATIAAVVGDCEPKLALTTSALLPIVQALKDELPGLVGLPLLASDTVDLAAADEWRGRSPSIGDLALLQYTSGSTGDPKGVRLTHRNILANEAMIDAVFRSPRGLIGVGWLPLHHDMGLIGNILYTLYRGGTLTLMSPLRFLERPLRWLEAISHTQAGVSGAPNFAYALTARRAAGLDLSHLDLSSWRTAFVGAEPIRASTLARFAEVFGPSGFSARSFLPCYGLAEATLMVSGAFADDGLRVFPRPDGGAEVVSVGPPAPGVTLRVVEPHSRAVLPSGVEGEVQVRGAAVSEGYWGRAQDAALEAAPDGPWLNTGDLGFLIDGELGVTGRLKELIVLRGRNIYPQDVERVIEAAAPGLRAGGVAAFAELDGDGAEALGVVAEVNIEAKPRLVDLQATILRALAQTLDLTPQRLALVPPRTVLKTSSGKIRRQATRSALDEGAMELWSLWRRAGSQAFTAAEPALVETLRSVVAARLGLPAAQVPLDQPLDGLGFDSVARMELLDELRRRVGRPIPASHLASAPTLGELALLCQDEDASSSAAAAPSLAAPPPRDATAPLTLPDPAWTGELEW